MRVLIIGASGLVGGNALNYFKSMGWEAVGTYHSFKTPETHFFDTLDPNSPDNFDVNSFKPQVIINCGALTNVDYCEAHIEESYSKTVVNNQNVLELAREFNSTFINISTDYVYDGEAGPYAETDKVNPLNVYGKHKLEAEENSLSNYSNSLSVRITNVYGNEIRGKNFVARLIEWSKTGEEKNLSLPYDQYATPINAFDIARVLYLLIRDKKRGIYNLASTDYMNRVQLANRVLAYFPGNKVSVKAVSTSELNQPAVRPLNGGLKATKFLLEYPDFIFTNVDDYLKTITNV